MKTKYSTAGTAARGTINNCGSGYTPWGTYLTGEENWSGYFTRSATDNAARGNDKSVTSLNRYGQAQGSASRHGWETSGADDQLRALEHQQARRLDRRHRRLPQRAEHLRLYRRDRPVRQDRGDQEAHRARPLRARERGLRQARRRQAARRVHGRRLARRVHLQVRLDRELGRRRRERPPTASRPATSTSTPASCTSRSSTPTAPASGSS